MQCPEVEWRRAVSWPCFSEGDADGCPAGTMNKAWARGQTDADPLPQLPPTPISEPHLFPVLVPVTSIPRAASSCLSATSERSGVLIQLPLLSSWLAPLLSPAPGPPHSLRDPVGEPPLPSLPFTSAYCPPPCPQGPHRCTPESTDAADSSRQAVPSRPGRPAQGRKTGCSWQLAGAAHGPAWPLKQVSQCMPRCAPPQWPSAVRLNFPLCCCDRRSEGLEQLGRNQTR